jgi:ATP-dependent RNA helicase RhlE
MNTVLFKNLELNERLLKALSDEGYHTPTPIQQKAIPEVLAGNDIIATAQTGTGKTAAFSLPMLQILEKSQVDKKASIRGLILTPTRELAIQIKTSLETYGRHLPLKVAVVVGGVAFGPQFQSLRNRPNILVATPGRLLDLMRQGQVRLQNVQMLVLDEADRMLDMGFAPDVQKIVGEVPTSRQTLLFSATMSNEVRSLANKLLKNPVKIEVDPIASISQNIEQKVLFVSQPDKLTLLVELIKKHKINKALVFTRTKYRANSLSEQLLKRGIRADAIHSNKSQSARQRTLSAFERGKVKILVATDIVARGIDVDGITHVINYELPNDSENYVHRIGRTARASALGIALSFCDFSELSSLKNIEKLTKHSLDTLEDHSYHANDIAIRRLSNTSRHTTRPRRRGRGGRWNTSKRYARNQGFSAVS